MITQQIAPMRFLFLVLLLFPSLIGATTITGNLRDVSNAPYSAARVEFIPTTSAATSNTVTVIGISKSVAAPRGELSIDLVEGWYQVKFHPATNQISIYVPTSGTYTLAQVSTNLVSLWPPYSYVAGTNIIFGTNNNEITISSAASGASGGGITSADATNAAYGVIAAEGVLTNNRTALVSLGSLGLSSTLGVTGTASFSGDVQLPGGSGSDVIRQNGSMQLANGLMTVDTGGNVTAQSFSGAGSDLTALSGTAITSGTVADARIASTIARDSEVPSIMATNQSLSSVVNEWGTAGLAAQRHAKPRRGIGTYLTVYNGTNWYSGGGTNIFCSPNEDMILSLADSMIKDGLVARGFNSICIEEGWQGTSYLTSSSARFPHGIKWLADQIHRRGMKLGLYSDLTYTTCCGYWGIGGTNTVAAANLVASWGIDYMHIDSCGYTSSPNFPWPTDVYGPFTQEARRKSFEDFLGALRRTNANITVKMNMNATPYLPWVGETLNGWQIAPNGDSDDFWSVCRSMDWAAKSSAQMRPGHTPSWYPFNPQVLSGGIQSFGRGHYSSALLMVGGAAMFQSDFIIPQNYEALESFQPGSGAIFFRNDDILRIQHDDLYIPPVKSFTNGTVEAWTKPLADGSTALLVFNRGYSTAQTFTSYWAIAHSDPSIIYYDAPAATATSIDIPVTGFGYASNSTVNFKQVLAGTNATSSGSVFTIQCGTNECSLWIVDAANKTKLRGDGALLTFSMGDVDEAHSFAESNIEGTGVAKITHATYGPSPFFSRDGLSQTSASAGDMTFTIPTPLWATNAEVKILCYSAFAGTVAWTNRPYLEWTHPTGRTMHDYTSLATITNTPVVVTSGAASWSTSYLAWPATNAPKVLKIVMLTSTNSSARYVLGPMQVRFQGPK